MKRITGLLFGCLFLAAVTAAQPKTKTSEKQPSMAEMIKLAETELSKLSPEAKRLMDSLGIKSNEMTDIPEHPQVKNGGRQNPKSALVKASSLPVLQTSQQVQLYLTGLLTAYKKNVDATLIAETDQVLGSVKDPSMVPMILIIRQQYTAAMYGGIKVAQKDLGNKLLLNNCAFLLAQGGYPEKAAPLFKYLMRGSKNSTVINNLGQAYLSMGENAEAKKMFTMGLTIDSTSSEMQAGMAVLLMGEGKIVEANIHVKKSLKTSYSEAMIELAEEAGIEPTYSDLKVEVPEYFNLNKFKPSSPIGTMAEWGTLIAARASQNDRLLKTRADAEGLARKMAGGLDPTKSMNSLPEISGHMGRTALERRARRMIELIIQDRAEIMGREITRFQQRSDESWTIFEKGYQRIQHGSYNDRFARCDAQIANVETYLQRSKQAADACINALLPKVYEWGNQLVYWHAFVSRGEAYKTFVGGEMAAFFESITMLSSLQNLDTYANVVFLDCRNNKQEKTKYTLEEMLNNAECPVSLSVNLKEVWAFEFNCDGMSMEGGKGFKIGFDIDSKKGEFTFVIGMGAEIDALLVGAGAKGLFWFKMNKDGPVDMGLKGEAGVSMHIGPVNAEENITAIMGVSSVNVDINHAGKTINIFSADAVKD